MVELLVVVALLVGLVGAPALVYVASWEITFGVGVFLIALGFAVGVPAGAYYHYRLWRALRPAGLWWLHPIPLNQKLQPADRPGVLLWMRVGAVFFGVIILGLVLTVIGVVRAQ
jgi:hypothetical protein